MRIRRYNPVVYPFKLWIVEDFGEKEFRKRFICEYEADWTFGYSSLIGVFDKPVIDKRSGMIGFIVVIQDLFKEEDVENYTKHICHEASHICDFMWRYLKEDYPGGEANAYLMGWIGDCLYKFIRDGQTDNVINKELVD